MIGPLIAIFSLNLTVSLVEDYGVVYKTLAITDASVTTPIVVTCPAHGVALASRIHGIVSDVAGTTEANGLWVLTPLDADHFSLTTFTAQGIHVDSVGVNAYTGGGQVQWAFPDGQILLGRRNKNLATMVATPRIVMIPTVGRRWDIEAYEGSGPNLQPVETRPRQRGSEQQQTMTQQPQLATEFLTFEVYVNGTGPNYGNDLNPDFEDFDATQAIVHAFYAVLYDATGGGGVQVLRESWPSQTESQGAMTQRGQQWMGVIEIKVPVQKPVIPFVPIGTTGTIIVQPAHPLTPDDQTTIVIPGS
jgi:hypothetical protein